MFGFWLISSPNFYRIIIFVENNLIMKKVLLLAFLSSVLVIALCQDAYGQRSSRRSSTDEYFDESGGFQHRLWYGSHVTLGFQGNTFQSTFQAGLAPMIGYKIFDALSIGPRGSLTYFAYRLNQGGGRDVERLNTNSWDIGGFIRFRPVDTFFGQIEANLVNEPNNIIWNNVTQELDVTRRERSAINIGLGYTSSSGGPWGFEALILYNVNPPSNDITSPLDYRFGLTYNF